MIRGTEHTINEYHRPPSPALGKGKTDVVDGSAPNTPPHQHPTSLTRIKSAASMVPGPYEGSPSPQARVSALTHETRLNFQNFVLLFQAFRFDK